MAPLIQILPCFQWNAHANDHPYSCYGTISYVYWKSLNISALKKQVLRKYRMPTKTRNVPQHPKFIPCKILFKAKLDCEDSYLEDVPKAVMRACSNPPMKSQGFFRVMRK